MRFTFGKNIFLVFARALTGLLSVFVVRYYYAGKVKISTQRYEHTLKVLNLSNNLLLNVLNIESGTRGYLLTLNEFFLDPYYEGLNTVDPSIDSLSLSVIDNKSQQERIDILRKKIKGRVRIAKYLVETQQQFHLIETDKIGNISNGRIITDSIRDIITAINAEEYGLLKKHKTEMQSNNHNNELSFFLLFLFLIFFGIVMFFVINNQNIKNEKLEALSIYQKEISNYSRSLIEASIDPLVTINPEGRITDVNEATVSIIAIKREHLIGSDFFNYFTDFQKANNTFGDVFKNGSVRNAALTLQNSNGGLIEVLFNGSVYKDAMGNVLGGVFSARDTTEQKKIESELLEAKVFAELATNIAEGQKLKAQNATKAKQQFLSNMSHEIRTPMNAIIGFTKVMLKTNLSVKQAEYLTAIKVSGDALIVLINDILDLAKVDAGKMVFEQIPFNLNTSVTAMLHLFEAKIQEKNLKLVTSYDHRIPAILVGDPVRLHQIILNLVSNAVKFTSKGQIKVSIDLLHEEAGNVTLQFAVADTGIGIPPDKMETIFENFQQASSETARLFGGTGLGLAIAKQLIVNQGGNIGVKSNPKGSVFSFELCFLKTTKTPDLDTEIITPDMNVKDIKVLVVEDIALNQLLMKTLLDDFGFDRDIADNGRIAIEKLQLKSYDIILMDLQMPEMNGFETTAFIRNTMNSKIPIIALTADVTTADLAKCTAVGMDDYIAKPVDERLLYKKIVGLVKKNTPDKRNISNTVDQPPVIRFTNLDYLNRLTKNNPRLMREMMEAYLKQTPPLVIAMKQSLEVENWELLYAAIHKMIPSFSIVGMSTDIEDMAKKLQGYAGARLQTDEIPWLVGQIENSCMHACAELEVELTRIKN